MPTLFQLHAELAALDAAQAPLRHAARDLLERTLAPLDAARAPLFARIAERAFENERHRDGLKTAP